MLEIMVSNVKRLKFELYSRIILLILEPVLRLWMFSCSLSGEYITSIHLPSQAASSRRGCGLAHQLGFGLHQASLKSIQKECWKS